MSKKYRIVCWVRNNCEGEYNSKKEALEEIKHLLEYDDAQYMIEEIEEDD